MKNEKLERLLKWSKGEKAPPLTLDISPTDRCNLRCLSCWQRGFKNIDSSYELTDEKLVSVVKEAIDLDVKEFEITGGGEPMIRRKLVLKMMRLVKNNGRTGNITTNGTLFSNDDIADIVNMKWDRITFSIDGPDAETNDFLRGKGSFEKIVENIDKINKLKSSSSSKKPTIKFNTVLSNKNYDKTKNMIELANSVECDIVSFEPLTVHSDFGNSLKLNDSETTKFTGAIEEVKKLADSYDIYTNVSDLIQAQLIEKSNEMIDVIKEDDTINSVHQVSLSSVLCFEPWWHLVIKVDGSAQPCCLYDLKEENVKDKNLKEIWFGKTFERIRGDIVKRKFSKFCSICNAGQVMENRKIRKMLEADGA